VTPSRWRQIEGLYEAAQACSPSDRADLLARADPDVRLVVQQMLDQPTSGSPLDHPEWQETSVTSLIQPEIGSQLGPYRIEALLGAGGMGMVFRAVDTRLGRAVAVKVSTEQFSKRFEREARAISALKHPNVFTLYDVGSLPSGAAYMVTELVEGETLREWDEAFT
jgi:serine/threonine protein kinase